MAKPNRRALNYTERSPHPTTALRVTDSLTGEVLPSPAN
jgi:hypothetical protein